MRYLLALTTIAITGFALASPTFASEITQDQKQSADIVQVSAQSSATINDIIKQQLQAIRERNDRVAYELSTNKIQEEFEDPQSFMRNLRRTKTSLYNHVGYEILPAKRPNSKFHKVMLTDKFGKSVMAMFKMQQGNDGEWKTKDIVVLTPSDNPI